MRSIHHGSRRGSPTYAACWSRYGVASACVPSVTPCAVWTAESFRVSTKPGQSHPHLPRRAPPRPARPGTRTCVITAVAHALTDFADICFGRHGLRRSAVPYGRTEHGHEPRGALAEGCQGSKALRTSSSSVAGHASKSGEPSQPVTTSPRTAKPWASKSPHRLTKSSRHFDQRDRCEQVLI